MSTSCVSRQSCTWPRSCRCLVDRQWLRGRKIRFSIGHSLGSSGNIVCRDQAAGEQYLYQILALGLLLLARLLDLHFADNPQGQQRPSKPFVAVIHHMRCTPVLMSSRQVSDYDTIADSHEPQCAVHSPTCFVDLVELALIYSTCRIIYGPNRTYYCVIWPSFCHIGFFAGA